MSGAGHAGHEHGQGTAGAEGVWEDSSDPFARALAEAMGRMMVAMHAALPSGDPDRDFLAMMVPHHQGAIEMARLLLVHGHDPLTRQMAEEILADQSTEVLAMRTRMAVMQTAAAHAEYPTLGGTRGGSSRP